MTDRPFKAITMSNPLYPVSKWHEQMFHAARQEKAMADALIADGWVRGEGAAWDEWTHPDVDNSPIPEMAGMWPDIWTIDEIAVSSNGWGGIWEHIAVNDFIDDPCDDVSHWAANLPTLQSPTKDKSGTTSTCQSLTPKRLS